MKKLAVAAAMVGLVGSFVWSEDANASRQMDATTSKYITMSKAKELALDELGGKVTDIEFEREGRNVFYEVEVRTETEEIEAEVDAITGKVLVTERERLHGAKQSGKWDSGGESVAVKPGKPSGTLDEDKVKPGKKQVSENEAKYITIEQAVEIAKKRVGNRAKVIDVEREGNHFEVELKHGKFEYEVKINAETGKILKVERD